MSGREDAKGGTAVVRERETRTRLARPRQYKVLLHNDNYTTMEFVVEILRGVFHHDEVNATAIMLHIHNHGVGVAGVYGQEVAETKVSEVMRLAEEAEFPLLCTTEPDDAPGEEPEE
jgi:ATP-dependent Clp protease adaptor protein ClpS